MSVFSNRKKVRGAKRQHKRLQQWRRAHLSPDLHRLRHHGQEYVKLTLDPWYRLIKRQPPVWLRREMTNALLDIYESWQQAARENADISYLRVWLSWPNFIDSQVVMATSERAAYYENVFLDVAPPQGFPSDLGGPLLERLARFEWREALSEYPVYAEDLASEQGRRWLFKRWYRPGTLPDGSRVYWVQQGRVWVGSKA